MAGWKCYVKNKGEIVTMISGDKYKTYKQAAIAGIEEVLDNLIENIMGKKDMSLADYQRLAMTTCMSSCHLRWQTETARQTSYTMQLPISF